MAENSKIGICRKEGVARISVNPNIYSMDVIYSAAHAFTKECYVLLDGDIKTRIIVELKPFEAQNLEELGRNFLNRLLSYQIYRQKRSENEKIRNLLLYRALAANSDIALVKKEGKTAKPKKKDDKKG